MISNVNIRNFRCIEELSFRPKKINIFVGRNNTGKSSILYALETAFHREDAYQDSHEYMRYLVRMKQKKAEIELDHDYLGIKATIFDNFDDIPEEFRRELYSNLREKIKSVLNDLKDKYKLDIDLEQIFPPIINIMKGHGITIIYEYILKKDSSRGRLISFVLDFLGYRESIELFKKELKLPKEVEEKIIRELLSMRLIEALAGFVIGNDAVMKEIDINFYEGLFESELDMDEKTLFTLENLLREGIFPKLKRLGKDNIVLEKDGELLERPIETYGDGLKALLTVLGLLYKSKDGILLLEEPENHLHPGYLSLLIKYLIEYSETLNVQLFIATHSMDLLDTFLKYENLKEKLQIIRMYNDENKEKVSSEILTFADAKEEYEKLKLDIRGI